ncbi:extracellular solute-binding protein [Clostridium sp. SYSU_GA19001]|uniref:extracellular solute-binding protein n=1 Tax=Clostridium caldaquaticum TaxID=2940653 RepID=UPI0020778B84|nr:extracellular solute-binding protein [Clostridium caldaquaticum]MCM8709684.1 extracellular solute-binding protein [Clostridium caldaquaticum]
MNKKLKSIITLTLSTVMTASLLVGCGSKTTSSGAGEKKSASSSNKDIVFWNVFTGPDGENMARMVDAYNKTNPKIKVKNSPIEAGDMYLKLPTVVSSGDQVPDVTIVHAERIPQFADNNMLMSIDKYITANGNIKAENYAKEGWRVGEYKGTRYGIPLDVHSFVTYYNKDLMDKYGAGVLDDGIITIDEAKKIGEASKKDGITGMGITWMRVKFLSWYAQLGGNLSEDGEKPSFNNSISEKVLGTIKDMVASKEATQDGEDPGQLFRSGKLVIWPEGIWMQNSLKEIKNLNWGMTHMVTFDASKKVNWSSSHQFVMFKNPKMDDERAAAIMDFIKWIGENSLEWAKAGQVPASLKIMDNEEFNKMPQSFLLKESDSQKIFNYKYYGYAVEALDKIVWETVFNKMEIKAGLVLAQKETEDRIKAGK